jgi:hypothetical protein
MALGRTVSFRIDVDGIVGAGLQAGFAANAYSGVKLYYTIITLVHRRDRTNTHTGRIGTVIAASHLKETAGIGKFALFNIFNPGSADPQRYLIFRLTGHTASMAADTGFIIDDKTVIHSGLRHVGLDSSV